MRVERLEVFGFKSFMERLCLPLEAGITGVVGPNGCGKSNIIDALRWVLGETRASQLRGGVLEDVIFNGTETLRPLGLAEVSLVIRAEKDSLLEELISYYESLEREGLSGIEQAVDPTNGQGDSATKGESQGIAAENNDKGEGLETVEVSEEALAGEMPCELMPGGDTTSPVAQCNDDSVEVSPSFLSYIKASLAKYSWLQSVSEVQVTRRLYRSGESEFFINKVPCRLKDLKELFRVLGLASRGYTIIAQGEIGRIITAKPDDRRQVIEEAAHIAGFREHINAVGKRLEDTKNQVIRLDDVIKEVTRQVANLKRQATRAITRAQLKVDLQGFERELFADTFVRLQVRLNDAGVRVEECVRQEAVATQLLQEVEERESLSRENATQYDHEIDRLRGEVDTIRDDISKRQRELGRRESRIRELKSLVHSRTSEIERLEERKTTLEARADASSEALKALREEESSLEQSLSQLDLQGEDEQQQLLKEIRELRDQQVAQDRIVRELRDKVVSAQSRREALQAQLASASPVTQLKKALGNKSVLPTEMEREFKLLVDGIKVPERFSKALQSVLAERSRFLVVDKISEFARSFQKMVLDADPNNKRGLGIGLFAKDVSVESSTGGVIPEVAGVSQLLDFIEVDPWCEGVVSRLLSRVWVADTLDSAFEFIEAVRNNIASDNDIVVVTEAGDLLSPWSFYSLRHDGGVIQMKTEIDRSDRVIEEFNGRFEEVVSSRDAIASSIKIKEDRQAELSHIIRQNQKALRELSNKQSEVRGRIQSEVRMHQQLLGDIEKIEPQQSELQAQIERIGGEIDSVTQELNALSEFDSSGLEERLGDLSGELKELEGKRRSLRDAFSQLLRDVESKRRGRDTARDAVVKERMQVERVRGEIASTKESLVTRYGEELAAAILTEAEGSEGLPSEERRALDAKVSAIRQRLEREGEVDPSVINQHEEESQRLEDLVSQRDDLVHASATLESTLSELGDACTRRFLATFEAIRSNFAVFGPKLYGGGTAELRLVDPENPLESGVEIMVRPPGKKPKSIDLLSGGEKALCAIALVFSMFMVRPSPICVLDEVDAPLDEANVQRFIAFIKEMSERTQFLMITHNKASMSAADTLVGVTMPQPGASKIITVSLQEAVKHVA